jgi:hypothetical protein
MICADPAGFNGVRFSDNGWYIGHDEPAINFFSNVPGSANNMRWQITLPGKDPAPTQNGKSIANFELYPAFWFSVALCDPRSYPENPCIPDSDKNTGTGLATDAGEAFLEFQFYPPGWSPFINQISCDQIHWCAALNIDSLECTFQYAFCNANCEEPVNFAFIQTDGVPTGPPGPASQNNATYTPNAKTLLMNPGDKLAVTVKDTSTGLLTRVDDLTTGDSGYMIASANNGFANTNLKTCSTHPFSFHPEYDTAAPQHNTFWGSVPQNVAFSFEIGHFQLGIDHDSDDSDCYKGPQVAGCADYASGGDLDFDGQPYLMDWPNGASNLPHTVMINSPLSYITRDGYAANYGRVGFTTTVAASETTCDLTTGVGCTVPPQGALFYPFYSQSGKGPDCQFIFGNFKPGASINDYGKDAQYGSYLPPNGGFASGPMDNPCIY